MFVEVRKIAESKVDKKDSSGKQLFIPGTDTKVIETRYSVVEETIDVDEIKAIRQWSKLSAEEKTISGDVTMLVLHGDRSKPNRPHMLIQENYKTFLDRIGGVIKL